MNKCHKPGMPMSTKILTWQGILSPLSCSPWAKLVGSIVTDAPVSIKKSAWDESIIVPSNSHY